jgi:hypothetical protein
VTFYLLVVGHVNDDERIIDALVDMQQAQRDAELAYVDDSKEVRKAIVDEQVIKATAPEGQEIRLYTHQIAGVIAEVPAWQNRKGVIPALQGSSQYSRISDHRTMVRQDGRAVKV